MDEQGLVGALMFPTLGVGIEDALKDDPEAAARVFHAFNRWLDDDWGYRYQDRLFAVPYVPMLDPAAAASELRTCSTPAPSWCNVRNGPVPVQGGYRSPFDRVYDPFWALAAEAGVVVADPLRPRWLRHPRPDVGARRRESSLFRSPLRGVVTKGRAVNDFFGAALCHLVFERFPGVRMAVVENGAGWAPEMLHRLDDAANRNPGYFDEHPRDVFGEHVWVTPFWEDDVPALPHDVRVDRLLLGSDWPHAEGTRQPIDFVTESLAGLPEAAVRRIGRENALEVLGDRSG